MPNRAICFILAILTGTLTSCLPLKTSRTEEDGTFETKKLERVVLPPKSVTIDVIIVRVPYQNREILQSLWNDVDEQELDWEFRKKINQAGFRAGIIGASIPNSLSQLLMLKGKPLRQSVEEEIIVSDEESTSFSSSKPYTLRAGIKSVIEIQNELIPSIPILVFDDGDLKAKNYDNARPSLTVSSDLIPDGSVRLNITPLIQYGSQQLVTKYQHGQLIRVSEQPTKTFDDLKCSLYLRPGQFLVMGALDNKYKRLGNYYFSKGDDDLEQKILVIRLLVTQHDGQLYQFPSFEELSKKKLTEEP